MMPSFHGKPRRGLRSGVLQAERVVLVTPAGYPLRAFAARADAGGLLGAHRGARAGPARDARRGLR